MRFQLTLASSSISTQRIPISYQYPIASAIYKILKRADDEYATFLHHHGYGKGYKMFCFSDIRGNLRVDGDRFVILGSSIALDISFHLPEASSHFIKGLFMSQEIEIADNKSKARFTIRSVEALPSPFLDRMDHGILQMEYTPSSPCVAGVKNIKGNYDFLAPNDERYNQSLIYNWREKAKAIYGEDTIKDSIMIIETFPLATPFKSRLVTIKAGTKAETKIRGFMSFGMKVIGERRFVELLYNSGAGLYNGQGMGMLKVIRK